MNDTETREQLAPKVAEKISRRCPGLAGDDATILAHEIISLVQVAIAAAQAEPQPGPVDNRLAGCG